jgi:O-antigen/teichoic acid export membrane protein
MSLDSLEKPEVSESSRSFSVRVARNSTFYFFAQIAGKGLFFLTTVYLARVLGAEEYGKFAFAFGLVTLLSVITKFGLDLLTSRDVGEEPKLAEKYLGASLTLRTLLSFLFLILIGLLIQILHKDSEVNRLILFLAISAAFQSLGGVGTSLFEGLQIFSYRSILNILMYGLVFLALLAIPKSYSGLNSVGPAFVIGALLYCLVSLTLSRFKIAPLRWSMDSTFLWQLFKMALPLGLREIFIGIYYRMDTVLLSFFTKDAVVGWYDAAYTFVYGLRLLPVTVAMVMLPALSNFYSKTPEKAANIYRLAMYYSIATGTLITFLTSVNSTTLVSLVYGRGYDPSAEVLRFLIWTCAIMFANAFQCIFLIITQQRLALLRATALGAVSNLILNLLLIPRWNMFGAALATILSEFCVFLACVPYLRKFIGFRDFAKFIFSPLIGVAFMYLLWTYSGWMHFIVRSVICTGAYFALLFSIKKYSISVVPANRDKITHLK